MIKNANQKRYSSYAKNKRWVVERTIHGIIDSENCLQDMKRK